MGLKSRLRKPEGTFCKLTYEIHREEDLAIYEPHTGDYLVTSSDTTAYRITSVRLVKGHTRKFALGCLRCEPRNVPLDARQLPLYWNKRNKKRS